MVQGDYEVPVCGGKILSLKSQISQLQQHVVLRSKPPAAHWHLRLGSSGADVTIFIRLAAFPGPSDEAVTHSRLKYKPALIYRMIFSYISIRKRYTVNNFWLFVYPGLKP